MKFSVLLPTRDRLQYLKEAVETVRRQDHADWEIIISDNQSTGDVRSYVTTLQDSRVRYFRTERLLPVTENWNRALNESTGEYVVMLGDDDGLRKGYFSTANRLIEQHDEPDAMYTGVYIYAHPGVMPGYPAGFLRPDMNELMAGSEPFWLARDTARQLVRGALNFKMLYAFNMQYSLVRRSFIESLRQKGPFFQSPFPDFYATNAMFLKAKRILVFPKPAAIIGITPKSYGFFHFNNRESEGADFLHNLPDDATRQRVGKTLLPGTRNNTCWLFAMAALKANYERDLPCDVNYRRYRFLQAGHVYKHYYVDRTLDANHLREMRAALGTAERVWFGVMLGAPAAILGLVPPRLRSIPLDLIRRAVGQHRDDKTRVDDSGYANLEQVFEALPPLGS